MKRLVVNKQHIRNHLLTTYSDEDLRTWFDPLLLRFLDASSVEVDFPHDLFARWFRKRHKGLFEREIAGFLGPGVRITYSKPERRDTGLSQTTSNEGITRAPAGPSFATFIYNRKNEFPFSMAREIAASPKNPPYNPFVICGVGVCGKTHLLRSIAGEMALRLPRAEVFCGSVADLAALKSEQANPAHFIRRLSGYGALCLDNSEDLGKYSLLQEDLAAVADMFRESKKPFVLTVDKGLNEASIDARLRSRLEAGLMVNLKKPDLDVRLRYAKIEVSRLRLSLKKEHILSLARRFTNFRNLEGILHKVAAYSEKSKRPITNGDLEKILRHADAHSGRPATPEHIIAYVAERLGLSRDDITGNSRQADIVLARQICMYACRRLMGGALSSIGSYFGGKNHATVLYACKKIEKNKDSDKTINTLLTQIRKKFLSTAE